MSYIVRDINPDSKEDMEQLAAMFNDFDNSWPGGFTRGIPETAESVRHQLVSDSRLAILIVEGDGQFLGFCDLKAQAGDTDRAYIPLLGARLSHHGKGVGKMLLREMVRRVTEQGFRELTLGTWGGNLKAVPLYKKTGFHWVPETDVWMRNFLPSLFNSPAGRAFFADRDWYACHEREVVVAPDDNKWKGMKVYSYRFRAGDDHLSAVFDEASGGLTALETPTFAIACSVPTEEGATGETYPITWEIEARGGKPLEVVLLTETDTGLEVKAQERLVVTGEARITRDLKVAHDAKPRGEGERAHLIRSTLIIDGQPFVLETGVKIVRPVEIEFSDAPLLPGRPEKIRVTLRNNLEREISGTLFLETARGLENPAPAQAFTLLPRLKTQCEFTLTARETGLFQARLTLDAGTTRVTRPVAFQAFGGSALGWLDTEYSESAALAQPGLTARASLRGGHLTLSDGSVQAIDQNIAQLGPPFAGWRLRPPMMPTQVEITAGLTGLTTLAPSDEFPGLVVERSVTFLSSDVAKIQYRVRNTTAQPRTTQLRLRTNTERNGFVAAPTPDGMIREPMRCMGDFPQGDNDLLAQGASFTESWVAVEEGSQVCGLVWQEPVEARMEWARFPLLTFDTGEIAPYSAREIAPLYLVAGDGNWETVRNWWRQLIQEPGVFEEETPETHRVLEVTAEPSSPALIGAGSDAVNIAVTVRRGKPTEGQLTLRASSSPGGNAALFRPETGAFALGKVERGKPFTATTRVRVPDTPAAGFLEAAVEEKAQTHTFQVPIISLGTGSRLNITEAEGEIALDNGYMTLRFAPGFLGAMTALEREGVNHLYSAYPQSRPFVWANPWFGGVHPFLGWWMGEEALTRETFTGGPCERTGAQGFQWQGVRVACEPKHKDRRWLRVEVEYLTLPGSNVVAIVSRYTNKATARMTLQGGTALWTQVGGTRENSVAHWEREGTQESARRGGFGFEIFSKRWGAVENPATGDALLLIGANPKATVFMADMAEEGAHCGTVTTTTLEPLETRERVDWLVHTADRTQWDAYRALKETRALP